MRTAALLIAALALVACARSVEVERSPEPVSVPSWGAGGSGDGGAGGGEACEPLPLVVPGVECLEGTTCKGRCADAATCCAL